MNTPAHLLLGAAVMARRGPRLLIWLAFLGAFAPDASLYVMAGVALFVLRIAPEVVFNELYFSDAWQTVFAIDNSVFVWFALLLLAWWRGAAWGIAFTGAALLHLLFDFPLHHDDGRPHFWPVSSWVFESPISYWDVQRGAVWIAPLEVLLSLVSAISLWRLNPGWLLTTVIGALVVLQLMVARVWLFIF
ncbi:MAG: cobalamin biosynthesis protein CobQ [Pseudomonadota bacterium]